MAWELFENIRGPRGDRGPAGTISSVSASALPTGAPATAEIQGTEDVHLHLGLPRGDKGDAGDRGPAGVVDSTSAHTVGYGLQPTVVLESHGDSVHAKFGIPEGAPGPTAIPTAEFVGQTLSNPLSAARPGFEDGLAQVAADPESLFREALDLLLGDKADLVLGKVPTSQLPIGEAATAGVIPVRGAGGRLPGIADPVDLQEAATKGYVDRAAGGGVIANIEAYGAVRSSTVSSSTPIKNALAALSAAGGGTLLFPPGNWALSETIILPSSNISISAYGAVIHARGSMSNMLKNFGSASGSGYNGNSNIEIRGGRWDHHGEAADAGQGDGFFFASCRDIRIIDVTILNVRNAHAIELNACQRVWIQDCSFLGFRRDANQHGEAIQLDSSFDGSGVPAPWDGSMTTSVVVTGCQTGNTAQTGFPGSIVGSHARPDTSSYYEKIIVIGNNITQSSGSWGSGNGVSARYWRDSLIANNVITKPDQNGVKVVGCHTVAVQGNVIYEPGEAGLLVTDMPCNYVTLAGNTILRPGTRGVFLYGANANVTVQGNAIQDARENQYAILIDGGGVSDVWVNVAVIGNTISRFRSTDYASIPGAIRVTGGARQVFITGNVANGLAGNAAMGVAVHANSAGVWVFGNAFPDFAGVSVGPVSSVPNYV